jgi:DNA invertase Pin-like site-specific DNA recombinase
LTAEQGRHGLSLDSQVSQIRAWAGRAGIELSEIVSDSGVSAGQPLAQRNGGRRIADLLDAQDPNVDAVVVFQVDRLGRNAAETMALLKRFRSSKIGLVSVDEGMDLNTEPDLAKAGGDTFFGELKSELDNELHPSKGRGLWRLIRGAMPF